MKCGDSSPSVAKKAMTSRCPLKRNLKMRIMLDRANAFFEFALSLKSRLLILIGVLALGPVFSYPLWNMTFYSNQYTDGLSLHIYAHQLEGGKTPNRDDLREINSLNHYIGMRPLLESDFSEFAWLPFGIGALILLSLRAMVLGKMANLIDVFVLFSYFGLFSLWSFYHRLYTYGHNLDPTAAIKVQPFTPPIFGTKQIANFTVQSYPGLASLCLVIFSLLLVGSIFVSRKPATVPRP
jgi:copper chaperone NosL